MYHIFDTVWILEHSYGTAHMQHYMCEHAICVSNPYHISVPLLQHGKLSMSVNQVILLVTSLLHMSNLVLYMSDFVLFMRLYNSAILLHFIQIQNM